jgi:uncharacterized protein
MAKLALGTAQFGLDYGINNKRGRIPAPEAFEILRFALSHDIDTLDTASSYGNSENVLGDYIKKQKAHFNIISKYVAGSVTVKESLLSSMKNLNVEKIQGYLVHHFEDHLNNAALWEQFKAVKTEGLVSKIGFSLYHPQELDLILKSGIKPDILNLPYNILDRRFEEYFGPLKSSGAEIHVRSIFLQGLLLKAPSELKGRFTAIKDKIVELNKISTKAGISAAAACLCFAAVNRNIDKVVIGVDSLENLKENVSSFGTKGKFAEILDELKRLREYNEEIILPTKWSDKP